MKKSLFLLFFAANVALAQQGIKFSPGPIEKVFQEARRTGKPVFVEVFSPTCHTCQSFIPTLADSRAGKAYNARFISTKLDINQPSTQTFLKSRQLFVPSLPLFLYFDPQQNLIHFAMSNNTVDEVIRHGNNALVPQARSQNMKSRYQQGDRSASFLIDYAMYNRVTKDTLANIAAMNDYARLQSPATYANQTNWLAIQKLVLDYENPMFQYMMGHMDTYRKAYGAKEVQDVAENILMSSLFSGRGAKFPIAKIMDVKNGLVKIGIDPKVAANRTLLPEVYAYLRSNQTAKAVERMDNQVKSNKLSVPEYIYIARLFNRTSPDSKDVPTVTKWINQGLAAGPNAGEQAELRAELAIANKRAR